MFTEQTNFSKNSEKLVRSLYQKKYRYEHYLCVVEGLRACREIYSSGKDLISFGVARKGIDVSTFSDVKIYNVEAYVFDKISSEVNSQGLLFVVKIPQRISLVSFNSEFALVLDKVSDPGNLGTIVRTCVSVGLKQIFCSSNSVDLYSDKTIRSALAAQFHLDVIFYDDLTGLLSYLNSKGYSRIYKTDPAKGNSCFSEENLFQKSVIVFGNEAHGVGDIYNSTPINIPMPGKFESLNLAQSVTVILFDAVRRKILR